MKTKLLGFICLFFLGMTQPVSAEPDLSAQELLQWSKRHLLLQPFQVVEKLDDSDPDFVSGLTTRLGKIDYQVYLDPNEVVERERIQYRPACFEADSPGCQGQIHFDRAPDSNASRLIRLLWGEKVLNDFLNSQLMLSDTVSGEKRWYQGQLFNYETWHFHNDVNAHFAVVSKGAGQSERIQQYQACLQTQCRSF